MSRAASIDPGVSSYLDLLRIVAASVVLLSHYLPILFGVDPRLVPGHDAVIVFFVMSGYVIAYVAEGRDRPLSRFTVHRLARLWSVLIPSLGLSLLAAILAGDRSIDVAAPPITTPGAFAIASLKTSFFVGQNWVAGASAPYNAPVWSLNYEAWYYLIFACFTFAPARARWPLTIAAVLVAGPCIFLLPCWCLGAWLYRRRDDLVVRSTIAYSLLSFCVLAYAASYEVDLVERSRTWLKAVTAGEAYHLGASTAFIGDSILALIVAASIVAVRGATSLNALFVHAAPFTRRAASRTLSIYLYHMPLLVIFRAGLGLGGTVWLSALCMVLAIVTALLLGGQTEARLPAWRRALWYVAPRSRNAS